MLVGRAAQEEEDLGGSASGDASLKPGREDVDALDALPMATPLTLSVPS